MIQGAAREHGSKMGQVTKLLVLFLPSILFILLLSYLASTAGSTARIYAPATSGDDAAAAKTTRTMHSISSSPPEDEGPPLDLDSKSLLLAEVAPRVAKDGLVMMALCNAGYMDLLLNWKASVDRLNITNYVIVPNDQKAAQQLSFMGVDWVYDPEVGLDDASSSEAAKWTPNKSDPMFEKWNRVVHKKAAYVRKILGMGLDVLVTDVDIVFKKNPLPLFADKSIDLFFINDLDKVPANGKIKYHLLCGGFWLGRNNERTLAFLDSVQECERGGTKEQSCFMNWFGQSEADRGGAKLHVMSVEDFPSGKYYFEKFWRKEKNNTLVKVKQDPYIVHNNWIIGHEQKMARFKKYGLLSVNVTELGKSMNEFVYDPDMSAYPRLLEFHRSMAVSGRRRAKWVLVSASPKRPPPKAAVFGSGEGGMTGALGAMAPDTWLTGALLSCPAFAVVFVVLVWARRRRASSSNSGSGAAGRGGGNWGGGRATTQPPPLLV